MKKTNVSYTTGHMYDYVQKLQLEDIKMFLRLVTGLLCIVGCSSTDFHVRQAGKQCRLPDITANDGQVFVTSLTGPCISYVCYDGAIFPHEYGCQRDGRCFPLGDNYTVGCFERACAPSNGRFQYVLTEEGCQFYSSCVSVNQTVNDGCQKYQCIKQGDLWSASYSLQVIEWGCRYQNSCIPVGQTVQVGCNTFQCTKSNNSTLTTLSMELVEAGCERYSRCFPVGDTFIDGCIQKTCTNDNDTIGYTITSEGCQYNKSCINVGQVVQDGCDSYQCTKSVDSTNTITTYSVDMYEAKCSYRDACYNASDILKLQCSTIKCLKTNNSLAWVTTESQGCELGWNCINTNEVATYNCYTYQCRLQVLDSGYLHQYLETLEQQCQNTYGQCFKPGEYVPYDSSGDTKNCTCEITSITSEAILC